LHTIDGITTKHFVSSPSLNVWRMMFKCQQMLSHAYR